MNETYNYCHVVGSTDVGRKRSANEDSMGSAITQNGLVSVVCDGMGGHVGGATASKIAIATILENLNNVYYNDPRIAIGESIDKANKAILQKTLEQPELTGMGSTCVLLLVRDGKVYIGHVGDSRIYLVRSKRIVQLTKDHSYVQMLVDYGQITKEEAENHPRKNEITNALGIRNMSPATVADDAIIPEAGDCFVLCSDGLSGMVSDEAICKIISRQSEMNAQERIDRLVALANENGGVDNITIQLVEFPISPNDTTCDKKKLPIWVQITCGITLLLALGIGGYFYMREKPTPETGGSKPIAGTENSIKCETFEHHFPKKIPFKKRAQIVELKFEESALVLKRDGKQLYEFKSAFDQQSLNVITKNVEIQYNNSLLLFSDENPGNQVIFYITQKDKTIRYKCIFDIIATEGSNHEESVQDPNKLKIDESEGSEVKTEVVAKVDTVYVKFKYNELKKDDEIRLLTSSKIFKYKESEQKVDKLGDVQLDKITFNNDLYWSVKPKKGQLLFIFGGESSNIEHEIIIHSFVKNSNEEVIVHLVLTPEKEEVSESEEEVNTNTEDEATVRIPA